MSQYNIQDQEVRKAFDDLQAQINTLRTETVKTSQVDVAKLPVAIQGDTSGRWYQIKVSDTDRTSLSIVFSDIGG